MENHSAADGPPHAPQRAPQPAAAPRARLAGFALRVTVAVLIAVLIVGIAYFLWSGVHILLQAFAGMLFAVFLSALADWLSRRAGFRYGWALVVVVVGLLILTGLLGWLLADRLATQFGELIKNELPQSFQEIRENLEQYGWGQLLLENVPKAAKSLTQGVGFSRLTDFVAGVAGFLEAVIVIFLVGIFGAAEPGLYKAGLLHLVPPAFRGRTRAALDAVAHNLRGWLVGQAVLMVIIGVTTFVGLWLMGIRLALTLGLIAGVLELVPYIGPWLSAVPALLIALLASPWHVLMVAGLYLFLHLLEGYVLLPLIQRRSIHLPPALTLVPQVLMGHLLGVLGLFVAAPLTVTVIVLVKMLYVQDTLDDQAVEVPGAPGEGKKEPARTG